MIEFSGKNVSKSNDTRSKLTDTEERNNRKNKNEPRLVGVIFILFILFMNEEPF